jgi:hypothetical protein
MTTGPYSRTTTAGARHAGDSRHDAPAALLSALALHAYTAGACHCEPCRTAYANYRANRRTQGHDRPAATSTPPTHIQATRHMRRDWFRHRIWHPAVLAAGLD